MLQYIIWPYILLFLLYCKFIHIVIFYLELSLQTVLPPRPSSLQASENGHMDTVRELLQHGAEVNTQDENGRTALHEVSCWVLTYCALLLNKFQVEGQGMNCVLIGLSENNERNRGTLTKCPEHWILD